MEKTMDVESGWKVAKSPDLQKWDKPGTQIFGKLLSIATIQIDGKNVIQYMIEPSDGERLKFLGTYDLTQKIGREHIGKLLRIKFLGEDASIKKNGNAMKVFDVHVKPDPESPQRDSGPITDEDIPF
jgi:hypothetical protein